VNLLITGGAGFIGSHLAKKFLLDEYKVTIVDSFKPAYKSNLCEIRLKSLLKYKNLKVYRADLSRISKSGISQIVMNQDVIIHLAAYPGVQMSNKKPLEYFDNNILSFHNIVKAALNSNINKFFFASSSSIYGDVFFRNKLDKAYSAQRKSFYADTKWFNELESFALSGIEGFQEISQVALRFFTVFGPYGRPDMAYWKFANLIESNLPINLNGRFGGKRDFTPVSFVVNFISDLLESNLQRGLTSVNIGLQKSSTTKYFASILAEAMNKKVNFTYSSRSNFEVKKTKADMSKSLRLLNSKITKPNLEEEIKNFAKWYMSMPKKIRFNQFSTN